MGGEPYWYYVKLKTDVDAALQDLRQREFEAGRYYPAIAHPSHALSKKIASPGAQHDSIDAAREAADATGTRSILDLDHVSEERDSFAVAPLSEDELDQLYGTNQPTREMAEKDNLSFLENVDRGEGVYVILYKDGKPDEVLFAGYSFD